MCSPFEMFFFCVHSMGLLHDQLTNCDCDDWPTCQGEDLHVQEADSLPQLDRSANPG